MCVKTLSFAQSPLKGFYVLYTLVIGDSCCLITQLRVFAFLKRNKKSSLHDVKLLFFTILFL